MTLTCTLSLRLTHLHRVFRGFEVENKHEVHCFIGMPSPLAPSPVSLTLQALAITARKSHGKYRAAQRNSMISQRKASFSTLVAGGGAAAASIPTVYFYLNPGYTRVLGASVTEICFVAPKSAGQAAETEAALTRLVSSGATIGIEA